MKRSFLGLLGLFIFSIPALAVTTTELTGLGAAHKVHAKLFMPDGKGPFPAVLVLHTSAGVNQYDIAYAQKLARRGYACLVPYYFDAYSITYETRSWATTVYAERILDDLTSEVQYLKSLPQINKDKVGAVGFSMGGYWSLILAGMGKVQAGVSYYGALTGGGAGQDMRYIFEEAFHQHSSPVLILHGKDDLTVSVRYVNDLENLLKGKSCTYELHLYPNAGHHFDRGGSSNAAAASDSWNRTLAFFKKYL